MLLKNILDKVVKIDDFFISILEYTSILLFCVTKWKICIKYYVISYDGCVKENHLGAFLSCELN